MREIKFRAWDADKAELIYPKQFFSIDLESKQFACEMVAWKKREVMQYTGLKDKNGIEIYEGDIVRYKDCCGQIVTDECKWVDDEGGFPMFGADYGCGNSVGSEYEVIGNIYQNPELLK